MFKFIRARLNLAKLRANFWDALAREAEVIPEYPPYIDIVGTHLLIRGVEYSSHFEWSKARIEKVLSELETSIKQSELPITITCVYMREPVVAALWRKTDISSAALRDGRHKDGWYEFEMDICGRTLPVRVVPTTQFGDVEFGVNGIDDFDVLRDKEDFLAALFAMSALS